MKMRTQEVLNQAANLFFSVDVKETLGQAAVIADCTDYEGSRKSIGVTLVTGRLDDAINSAMAKAAAKFLNVELEEDEIAPVPETVTSSSETATLVTETPMEPEQAMEACEPEDSHIPTDEAITEETATPAMDSTPEIPEEIHPLITNEGEEETICFGGSDAESFEEAVSGTMPETIPEAIPDAIPEAEPASDIVFGAAEPAKEETVPETEPTPDETPEEDGDDFIVAFGRHKTRNAKASVICNKILAGDKFEMDFLKTILNARKMARADNALTIPMDKFLAYAKARGIAVD